MHQNKKDAKRVLQKLHLTNYQVRLLTLDESRDIFLAAVFFL